MPAERPSIGVMDRKGPAVPEASPPTPGPALERLYTQTKQRIRDIFSPTVIEPIVMDGQVPFHAEPSKFYPLPVDELKAVAGDALVKDTIHNMTDAWEDKQEEAGGDVVHLFWGGRKTHVADANSTEGILVFWIEGDDQKTAMEKVTTVTVDFIERYAQVYSAKYIDPQVEAAVSKIKYAQDIMASYGFTSPAKTAPISYRR